MFHVGLKQFVIIIIIIIITRWLLRRHNMESNSTAPALEVIRVRNSTVCLKLRLETLQRVVYPDFWRKSVPEHRPGDSKCTASKVQPTHELCKHGILQTSGGNFPKFTTSLHLGTEVNWLDVDVKRWKVEVTTRTNSAKTGTVRIVKFWVQRWRPAV